MSYVTSEMMSEAAKVFTRVIQDYKEAKEKKKLYIEKVEVATGYDVFKYLMLMDSAAIEEYVALTRLQAVESFKLTKYVAVIGFILIASGIILGIGTSLWGSIGLNAAYLASLAGILTEFISGVFFYIYNRTLQQMNLFHDKMLTSKKVSMSFLANSITGDDKKREETQAELSKMLMSSSIKKDTD